MSRFSTRFVTKFGSCFENWQSSIPLRKGKQLQLDKQNRFDFCERALANLSSSLLPISVFKGTMMDAVNYQWSPFSSTGKIYRVVQKKGTVFLSTSQSWPAVAGCSKAETFSQLSSNSFSQPCIVHKDHSSYGCPWEWASFFEPLEGPVYPHFRKSLWCNSNLKLAQ